MTEGNNNRPQILPSSAETELEQAAGNTTGSDAALASLLDDEKVATTGEVIQKGTQGVLKHGFRGVIFIMWFLIICFISVIGGYLFFVVSGYPEEAKELERIIITIWDLVSDSAFLAILFSLVFERFIRNRAAELKASLAIADRAGGDDYRF